MTKISISQKLLYFNSNAVIYSPVKDEQNYTPCISQNIGVQNVGFCTPKKGFFAFFTNSFFLFKNVFSPLYSA
jgi:hypothetical protein